VPPPALAQGDGFRPGTLELSPHRFRLQVGLHTFVTELMAPAGLLGAAEGHPVIKDQLAVQRYGSRLQPLREAMSAAEVRRPGGRGQTEVVSLAIATASSSSNGSIVTTEPKISCRYSRMPGSTLVSTVG
jgi:hypothetical protein